MGVWRLAPINIFSGPCPLEHHFRTWDTSCWMKLEVNSQTSKHKLKPVFIGFYASNASGNSGYYASVHGFHVFLGQRTWNVALEKEIVTHMMKKCGTCDTAFWTYFF